MVFTSFLKTGTPPKPHAQRYLAASISGALFLLLLLISGCMLNDIQPGTGYAAKNICTGIFVSGTERRTMANDYVAPEVDPLHLVWKIDVNRLKKTVTVRDIFFKDYYATTAVYREGLGCTCLIGKTRRQLMRQMPDDLTQLSLPDNLPWPRGAAGIHPDIPAYVDMAAVQTAIDESFKENAGAPRQTVAVAVVHGNKLIAEQYAEGFTPHTPILGWSMSKSVTSALVGIQSGLGLLSVSDSHLFEQWEGTPKADITIEHLLHMSSGLKFYEESRGDNNNLAEMLYSTEDYAQYMMDRELYNPPGTVWHYSTGETMLLARIVQDNAGGTLADGYRFMQEELFHRIDIANAVVEFDPSGTFVGGAGFIMPARDWARIGQLYLQNGLWNGAQVLPENWVAYSLTPAPTKTSYGAQIWLNQNRKTWPELPEDTISFLGHNYQRVVIVPSHDLVVVRMGYTFDNSADPTEQLVKRIMEAID